MSFNIEGGVETVYSCTDCGWCQIEKHFGEGQTCLMCGSDGEKISEIEPSIGMSDFKYREIQTYLEQEISGVGSATISSIVEHFEGGDDFIESAELAYQQGEYDALAAVDGIGDTTAENIALGLAEKEVWEDGLAESSFKLSA